MNVINDYLDDFINLASYVQLTDEQYKKYRFKPKLLCNDIYGNPELYYIIMLINRVIDVKDFDFKRLRMMKIDVLNALLSEIYNSEKKTINEYNSSKGTE